ncbi:MAG TPA: Hpt domain-containing protein, partial [Pseudomonadales bacterium]|nr:Hpt domain-containing protein [Pseudomonadales bacterium]
MSEAASDTNGDGGVDKEIMEDFFQDFKEAHQHCEHTLIELEFRPTDRELLHTLFRSVHTIKGNLIYVGLKAISPLLQSVEDLLDALRSNKLFYDKALSDLIILALDTIKLLVRAHIEKRPSPISTDRFEKMCAAVSAIVNASPENRLHAITDAIVTLDPSTKIGPNERAAPESDRQQTNKVLSQEQRILE